jgi:signal transduction histidine kinase
MVRGIVNSLPIRIIIDQFPKHYFMPLSFTIKPFEHTKAQKFSCYFFSILLSLLLHCFPSFAQTPSKVSVNKTNVNNLNDTLRVLLFDSMANASLKMPDTAQRYVNEGRTLAEKINYKKGIALLVNDQALVYMKKGQDDKALDAFSKAVIQFKTLGLEGAVGRAYRDMALVNLYKAEHEKAMALVLKALNIFEANNMDLDIPFCYTIMGYIHVQQGDLDEGIKYHQKSYGLEAHLLKERTSLSLNEKLHLTSNYIQSCLNLGNVYSRKGDFTNALDYLGKGLEMSQGQDFLNIRIKILISTAVAYDKMKNKKQAEAVLKQAVNLAAVNKMYYDQSVAYANLASLSADLKVGLRYYDSAMTFAKDSVDDVMLVVNILKGKSGYATEKGDYKEALKASEMYHALNDSIFSVRKTVAINDLESTNQLNKTKVTMQQMELKNLKSRETLYFIGFFSFALIIALIITVVYQAKLKKLHNNVLLQKQALYELNESKDKIFSVISHDLRSPLMAVSAILYLMKTDGLDADKRESYLAKLIRQNDNALDTMNKLLAWGSFEIRNEKVEKDFIVKEELKSTLQSMHDLASEKNITFLESLDPNTQLTTNPYHFDFIIRNLLQNAIKFTPAGGKVQLEYYKETDKEVFSVIDTGAGIAPHIADKIYVTTVESGNGTKGEVGIGIGLMLVKKYADINGYQLEIDSKIGHGTTFRLFIPTV